jgi:hypothetical protein
MPGGTTVILVQSLAKGAQNVSTHRVERRHKHPSPQLVDYLRTSSAADPFTGAGSAGERNQPQKPERDTERFLKDWDKEWHKVSAKKHD